jgi:hypothetical protein
MILTIAGLCTSRWRIDTVGTKQVEGLWYLKQPFSERTYGIMQVKGSQTQSWNTLSRTTCDFMNYAILGSTATSILSLVGSKADGSACKGGSEACLDGFSRHMTARCEQYQKIWTVNTSLLAMTLVGILMGVTGILLSCMGGKKKMAGIGFGLLIVPSVILFILNLCWLGVTDAAFTTLAITGWYPYPNVGIGYYLHLEGTLLLLISSIVFGILVLPDVNKYDAAEEKLEKWKLRELKLFGRKQAEQQYLVTSPQMPQPQFNPQPQFIPQQQMNPQMQAYSMNPQNVTMAPYGAGPPQAYSMNHQNVTMAPYSGPQGDGMAVLIEETEIRTSIAPTAGANVYGSPQAGGDFGLSPAQASGMSPAPMYGGQQLLAPGGMSGTGGRVSSPPAYGGVAAPAQGVSPIRHSYGDVGGMRPHF